MIPLHQPPLKLKEALSIPKDDYVSKLKDVFRTKFNKKNVVFTADARNAIYLALRAMGLREQDEVIIPGYITQLMRVVIELVCKPVYVDIDQRTFNIDPDKIERHITNKTRAILVAHLYGNPCNMHKILEIAKINKLLVIEDAAQAFGGRYDKKMLGSFGDFIVFSFKFSKDTTCFRGGALLTDKELDIELKPIIRFKVTPGLFFTLLALKQIKNTPTVVYSLLKRQFLFPYFSRDATKFDIKRETLCNYQCYLLYQQLARIESIVEKRRQNATYYSEKLRDLAVIPEQAERGEHTYYRYTIQVDNRDQLYHYLLNQGIEADKMYNYSLAAEDVCPQSAMAGRRNLNIPVHQELTQADIEKVIAAIHKFKEAK